jgi:NAD(P)-dependent dehydrogenase (short-subunit alcohol dehydrogenase family)
MQSSLSSPVCIVTGGSLGIGAAVCEKFARNGYAVINLDIQPAPSLNTELPIEWIACDMTNGHQVKDAIDQVTVQYGRIDALISNAGKHYSGTIEDTSDEDFDALFNLNVKGAMTATKAVLPQMKLQRQGVILFMSSEQALVAKPNSFAYNLSKTALASLAKTTALDYASYGIRSNAVCPGTVETPLYHNAIDRYVERSGANEADVHASEAALQPLGRLAQPQEVAALCYFLASDDAKFITGSLQVIDGGYTTQ